MRRLALLWACLLTACADSPDLDGRAVEAPPPQVGVDVREVRATLAIDPEALHVDGTATLVVRHPSNLSRLTLGLDDALEVQGVRVDGAPVQATREADALAVPVSGDSSVVQIAYAGVPAAGLYADRDADVVYTDGWPDRTAGWLPMVHHPSDPARLDLTLDVPERWEVVATGLAVGDTVTGGRRVARFVLDGESPSYTFAFALGDFSIIDETSEDGRPRIRHALLADQTTFASRLRRTGAALDTLAALFGPYPYASYTTVQVPMAYAGMENAAAPFLRAELYGADVPGRNAVEEVNFHELIHQWWGNAIVPADWADLWLAEGPATYLTADLYARLDGPDAGRRHLALTVQMLERPDRRRPLVRSYDDPSEMLTPTVYQKGAAVLHTLRLILGEAAFWDGLRTVQTEYADRPLSTAAFQSALEQASGRDLDAVFDLWVYGGTVPTLRTRWDAPTRTLAWEIEDDAGTLAAVPFELLIRQGGTETVALATDGVASVPGDAEPEVWPVGVMVDVE